jgi:SAM-dependent methyltransferase
MHLSSLEHMQDLVSRYLDPSVPLRILDLGSCDVNGRYRYLFANPKWRYVGVDVAEGPNVDVILTAPYKWPFANEYADLIISGQAFEHIEFFWLSWLEMVRVLRKKGLIFLIAPSRGPEHPLPVDCWRFLPGGYRALAKYSGRVEVVEVNTDWKPHPAPDSVDWGDTVGVFRKIGGVSLRDRISNLIRFPWRA